MKTEIAVVTCYRRTVFENEDAAETLGKASEAVKPTEPAASPKVQESPKPSDKPQKTETSTKRKTRTRKLKTQNHREKLKANPQTNPKARLRVARKLHCNACLWRSDF